VLLRELLSYAHPLLATVALLLAFLVFRDGFAQRKQRLRRIAAPSGSRARHVKVGPWASGLIILSALGGLVSTVLIRKWALLASWHGRLGVGTALLFALMWWMGRKLIPETGPLAGKHGVLGLLALFAGGLTGLLGISMLP
jgi:hypothetical protein